MQSSKLSLKQVGILFSHYKAKVEKSPEIGILLVIFTLASALLLNILANQLDLMLGFWAIVGLTLVIVAVAYFIIRFIVSAPTGPLPDDIQIENYAAHFVNTPDLVRQANAITHTAFGDSTVPDAQVEGILLKNKQACLGLFEKAADGGLGKLVGYASCWPIRKDVYDRLRLGEGVPGGMSEADIAAEHVLADTEIERAEVLFIPAVAVLGRETYKGKYRAAVLACEFLQHMKKTYAPAVKTMGGIKLFLVGFTPEGQRMTERLAGHLDLNKPTGFLTLYDKEQVPFYEKFISRADWERAFDGIEGRLLRSLFAAQRSRDD
ncbi:MAG TPA: hypothetical protein VH858_10865 [Hyphomicrobiales bacterium]